ncbi:hypothetical protein ACFWOJ_06495 [Streptomyces sp. NPDC058439]|uniref:hypothetical protein n=1 Tax=Streptomyces sp. NPDC058439 TaxID=3346500 RepID=UPI0036594EAB
MKKPKQLNEFENVYDFLYRVRLHPEGWVPHGSLTHLGAMLVGYRVAMTVYKVDEEFPFYTFGDVSPFDAWLGKRNDCLPSLGWAAEIEREAKATNTPAVELFFTLLDQFQAERQQQPR